MKALVDYRMKEIFLKYLEERGFKCVKISCDKVYDEVSGHTDIFFTDVLGTVVMAKNVCLEESLKFKVGRSVENGYPNTAKYNVCINEKYAIGNFGYVEKSVTEEIDKKGLIKINVKQGYTRCSLFSIDDTHYITSDISIKRALEKEDLNVLYIENEDIKLLDKKGNYSKMHGFIGGCLAKINNDIILFGDRRKLKSYKILEEYIKDLGYNLVDFIGEDIIDYGSIIIID